MVSEWFVTDLLMPDWPNKRANHIIRAIGSSSHDKCSAFAAKCASLARTSIQPKLYASYQGVYHDPDVDCVYIGTPHSLHKQNCLEAIDAGKNVLCEKPFAMNAHETSLVFAAAEAKGVFIMEAVWTRFYPLVKKLQHLLHAEKRIGIVRRTFCDYAKVMDLASLPPTSRYRDPALGAGSLLDIGIYPLTWGLITLSNESGSAAERPDVVSMQTLEHGIDVASTFLLHYPSNGRQGVLSSTTNTLGRRDFARIDGSAGYLVVHGPKPSSPESFTVYDNDGGSEHFAFDKPGHGFWWEADEVALDLQAGRKQSETMPWAETVLAMEIMDGIRRRGGARFPVDDW